MGEQAQVTMLEVVPILGLVPKPGQPQPSSQNYVCPICGGKYKLNVNFDKNTYHCVKCGAGGGIYDLYSRVRFGHLYDKTAPDAPEIKSALKQEVGVGQFRHNRAVNFNKQNIMPASDDILNHVYRALFALPALALSENHKKSLMNRGLTEEQTKTYRSMPNSESAKIPSEYYRLADSLEREREALQRKSFTRSKAALGLYLTGELQKMGIKDFAGVPGWFKLGEQWCLFNVEGIIIPTKNLKGQIVSIQIRTDNSKLRYITLSRKDFPGAVTTGISRVHVAMNTTRDTKSYKVILTEGPLKANVIAALIHEPVVVLAIQGVNNTKCLHPVLTELREKGVNVIYNALDMDRLTNNNVRRGSKDLRRLLNQAGFRFPNMVWDEESCRNLARQYRKQLPDGVRVNPKNYRDVWSYTNAVVEALESANAIHSTNWPSRSKGLDDWLKFIRAEG